MADPLLDLGAQREVRRDAATEQHRFDRVLRGGARRLLRQDLGDRLLERGRDVGHGQGAFRLERAHEAKHCGLETREREVVAGERGARQRERGGIAVARDALDRGSARKAEAEETRDLVEGLACGVVDGAPERSKAAVSFHQHEVAVRATHDQHHRGDLGLGCRRIALVQPVRVDVTLEVVHADEWQARGEGEPAPIVRADEETADESRSDGRGHGVDGAQLDTGFVERLLRDAVERA